MFVTRFKLNENEIAADVNDYLECIDTFLQECQEFDDRMQLQTLRGFIAVAIACNDPREGPRKIFMSDLGDKMNLSQSSVSRTCAFWGETHRNGKPGANLLKAPEDPLDRRQKKVGLTEKGYDFLARVMDKRREIYDDGLPDNPWEGFGDPFEDDWDGPADELVEARLAWVAQMNGERW